MGSQRLRPTSKQRGYKTQPSVQSRTSLVAYRHSELISRSHCECTLLTASNPSLVNMVLEDSDVEMIVAEIEVSVSRWLFSVHGRPYWIMAAALSLLCLEVARNGDEVEF